jgi:hypothetical protein
VRQYSANVAFTPSEVAPAHPYTLAIDVGGTGLKASVLSQDGAMVADRVKVETKYPMPPEGETGLVEALTHLVKPLPAADRVSCGFPGMVRNGLILSAPHFVTKKGPGTAVDQKLFAAWAKFDLAGALTTALGKPTKVANDADIQGAAVVKGNGLEVVITLGTGFGSAFFNDGHLMPHLERARTRATRHGITVFVTPSPTSTPCSSSTTSTSVAETPVGSTVMTWAKHWGASPSSTTQQEFWAASSCGKSSNGSAVQIIV